MDTLTPEEVELKKKAEEIANADLTLEERWAALCHMALEAEGGRIWKREGK